MQWASRTRCIVFRCFAHRVNRQLYSTTLVSVEESPRSDANSKEQLEHARATQLER